MSNRMLPSQANARYTGVAIALHWLIALLIVAVFLLGLTVDVFPHSWEDAVVGLHKDLGLAIILLALARIVWRLVHRPPPAIDAGSNLARLSEFVHVLLYVLMFAVPLIGIVYSVLRGQGFDFGLVSIGPFMEANRALARPVKEVHELAAWALIALAGFHAVAALFHHYVLRDGVLLRMMPEKAATRL